MARVTLTKKTVLGSKTSAYSTANSADLAMAAANVSDKNQFACSGNDLVFAHNTGASPVTITINSVADPQLGRTGDIAAFSLGAGEYGIFGPFSRAGWQQSDGYVYLEASAADVKFGVVQL